MWVSPPHTLVVPRLTAIFQGMDVRHPRGCPQRRHRKSVWNTHGDYACQVHAVLDAYGTDDFYRAGENPAFPWSQLVGPGRHQAAAWYERGDHQLTLRLFEDGAADED